MRNSTARGWEPRWRAWRSACAETRVGLRLVRRSVVLARGAGSGSGRELLPLGERVIYEECPEPRGPVRARSDVQLERQLENPAADCPGKGNHLAGWTPDPRTRAPTARPPLF